MRYALHTWSADRNATFIRTIEVPLHDLTGAAQRMQVRNYPDELGTPLLNLAVAPAGTQGLSVAVRREFRLVNGQMLEVDISDITIRISKETLQALVPPGTGAFAAGGNVELFYDHLIALPMTTLQPLMRGPFIIEPGVTIP